jgi:hypothetical protein
MGERLAKASARAAGVLPWASTGEAMTIATEEIQIAIFGIELSDSEAGALREHFEQDEAKGGPSADGACEAMLTLDFDANEPDVSGPHYNQGYLHAVGIEMGSSGYADVAKLVSKPPSKFQKKFDSEFGAILAKIGIKRRAKAILVTQHRAPS